MTIFICFPVKTKKPTYTLNSPYNFAIIQMDLSNYLRKCDLGIGKEKNPDMASIVPLKRSLL